MSRIASARAFSPTRWAGALPATISQKTHRDAFFIARILRKTLRIVNEAKSEPIHTSKFTILNSLLDSFESSGREENSRGSNRRRSHVRTDELRLPAATHFFGQRSFETSR